MFVSLSLTAFQNLSSQFIFNTFYEMISGNAIHGFTKKDTLPNNELQSEKDIRLSSGVHVTWFWKTHFDIYTINVTMMQVTDVMHYINIKRPLVTISHNVIWVTEGLVQQVWPLWARAWLGSQQGKVLLTGRRVFFS